MSSARELIRQLGPMYEPESPGCLDQICMLTESGRLQLALCKQDEILVDYSYIISPSFLTILSTTNLSGNSWTKIWPNDLSNQVSMIGLLIQDGIVAGSFVLD